MGCQMHVTVIVIGHPPGVFYGRAGEFQMAGSCAAASALLRPLTKQIIHGAGTGIIAGEQVNYVFSF